MKCFVVNLDRDKERLEATRALFASAGMDIERVSAVDARSMTAAQLREACPGFRFYLANARRVKPGEIGCALSHRKAWETLASRGLPLAAVFEDDILADMDRLREHLASIEATDDPLVPTVWLMNRGLPRPEGASGIWYDIRETKDVGRVWSTFCYALNAAAAKRLVRILTPMANVVDAWSTYARCGVRVLAATEAFATTRGVPSTLMKNDDPLWRRAWFRRFYWFRYRIAFWTDLFLKSLEIPRQ